ncbi:MAG: HAMP domain-containing sensor histidine kinase [Spirosomataceae bacterium]
MKIRYRIALQFTLILGIVLLVFSGVVYWKAENQRQQNFYDRLERRAFTTARLLVDVREFDANLLKLIDKNSSAKLTNESVFVFNYKNELIYSNVEQRPTYITPAFLDKVRLQQRITLKTPAREVIGVLFAGKFDRFVVVAAATDPVGEKQIQDLIQILSVGFWVGVVLSVMLSLFLASQALRPIQSLNKQIDNIRGKNWRKRVRQATTGDEISQLAGNFNAMLDRLEQAFIQQKQFVSHASHELRTPLASLKTEIQVGLSQPHQEREYREILLNLEKDAERLINLSNDLLQLAKVSDKAATILFEPVRMEEVLLNAINEVQQSNALYKVSFDFEQLPEDENSTLVTGNESLLQNLVVNLLSNACKYSPHHQAQLLLGFNNTHCIIKVVDKGIGIAQEDLPHIFEPFYRAQNGIKQQGFGVGLSVVHQIVELHGGIIEVQSQLNVGTTFVVQLKHL